MSLFAFMTCLHCLLRANDVETEEYKSHPLLPSSSVSSSSSVSFLRPPLSQSSIIVLPSFHGRPNASFLLPPSLALPSAGDSLPRPARWPYHHGRKTSSTASRASPFPSASSPGSFRSRRLPPLRPIRPIPRSSLRTQTTGTPFSAHG